MDLQRAAFPKVEWDIPPDNWEIASRDTWAPWYSIEDAEAKFPLPASALTAGLVTEFTNRTFWTLHDGKPARVKFNRRMFIEGIPDELPPDLELEEVNGSQKPVSDPVQIRNQELDKLNAALKDTTKSKLEKFADLLQR